MHNRSSFMRLAGLLSLSLLACGCTTLREWVHNGFKVGPNYGRPPAATAADWIDAADPRVRKQTEDLSRWWTVFNDPNLDNLVCFASQQNLQLREAAFRVLQARAQLGIDKGELFPQQQTLTGNVARTARSVATTGGGAGPRSFGQFALGFNLAWELDVWGRLRRIVESDVATLDATIEDYDAVLVTLLGDVATDYAQIRTIEQRIKYAKQNVELQTETLTIVEGKFKAGAAGLTSLDVDQARSTLGQTQAQIPELEIQLRQTTNALCVLLGVPPEDLRTKLGEGGIPTAAPEVAVGIPADLLRRRPDVRRAERQAASQSARIGVAEAELYPHFSLDGMLGLSAAGLGSLFTPPAMTGTIGGSFTWNVLNYGRIRNNVRLQDARFQELIAAYQQQVLTASQEVEDGLVQFLKAQERAKLQATSVEAAERAVKTILAQFRAGVAGIDMTRVTLLQQTLVQQQDTLAQSQGEIAAGLIQVYRALGGGWESRINGCEPTPVAPQAAQLPAPKLEPKPEPKPEAKPETKPEAKQEKKAGDA
jgi:NodT family efflux transporter outer membrane factor (OMF) lipoprotein